MTAFLTSWARTRPSTSVRKSCARSDQRMPPRAIGPKRRCTPPTRGEYTQISRKGRGCGAASTALLSSLKAASSAAAGLFRLIEVGAHGGIDQVEDLAQDAVLIQARHAGERALDAQPHRRRGRLPLLRAHLACGIEAHMKQLEEIAGDAGVAGQRVREVAHPERRGELAQVGGIGPERGRLAPVGAGRDDQAVEPVVVGVAAQHCQKAALEPLVVPLRSMPAPSLVSAPCRAASSRAPSAKRGRM